MYFGCNSGKITKTECLDLLEKHGNVQGAMRIFAKVGDVKELLKLFKRRNINDIRFVLYLDY